MLVDDLVVCGAEPLFLTDYIATGRVVPERIAAIVKGIAEACVAAGCALVGGETAEHPGLLGPDEYDVAGSTTGVVEASQLLGPGRVRPGDVVVAMASSGLHSNGYSLVRHVLLAPRSEGGAGRSLEEHVDDLGRTLGEELLEPTRIYAKACLDLARDTETHAMSHITGGGLAANLERVLPVELTVALDRTTWSLPPVFRLVARDRRASRARTSSAPELRRRHGLADRRRRRRPGDRAARRLTASRPGSPARCEVDGRGRPAAASRCTATTAETSPRPAPRSAPDISGPPGRADVRESTTVRLGLPHEQLTQTGSPQRRRPNVRGGHPWGAAVQRRSRPRLLAI